MSQTRCITQTTGSVSGSLSPLTGFAALEGQVGGSRIPVLCPWIRTMDWDRSRASERSLAIVSCKLTSNQEQSREYGI